MLDSRLKAVISAVFLLGGIIAPLQAEENNRQHSLSYTLQQAIDRAMTHNPKLTINRYQLESADSLISQSKRLPNPNLSIRQENFAGNATEDTQQSFIVAQPIELFGQRKARIGAAVTQQQLSQLETSLSQAQLLNAVTAEFYRVLGSYEEHILTEESIRVSQELTDIVASKSAAGKVSPVELSRAKILLSKAKISAARAELHHHETERRLAILLGFEEDTAFTVQGNLNQISPLPDLEKLLERLKKSPHLKKQTINTDIQKSILAEQKSRAWPDMSIYFGINRFQQADTYAYQAGLTIDVPFFNRNQGNIQSAISQIAKTRAEYDSEWLNSSHQLRDAFETMMTTHEHVVMLQNEIVPGSQQILQTQRSAYENGKLSLYEVLDAQQNWLESKGQTIDALISFHVARSLIGDILGESIFHNPLTEVTP